VVNRPVRQSDRVRIPRRACGGILRVLVCSSHAPCASSHRMYGARVRRLWGKGGRVEGPPPTSPHRPWQGSESSIGNRNGGGVVTRGDLMFSRVQGSSDHHFELRTATKHLCDRAQWLNGDEPRSGATRSTEGAHHRLGTRFSTPFYAFFAEDVAAWSDEHLLQAVPAAWRVQRLFYGEPLRVQATCVFLLHVSVIDH